MVATFHRRGPDRLQKFFLYLILVDWLLLLVTTLKMQSLSFFYGSVIAFMLFIYNLFLANLCRIRARRAKDTYLIYPVVLGAFISFLLVSYFFILA
ncbi:conserved hypothetical protein [Shewanella denitrificans OS217]|jgi:hypothetical protein|uniref:Uncharacterized protein n=1 Tax=Shewanella denitrificans (strain OS217 / ATCC BAA-1090 / DSM 15013) TaxID=318161 RepID=Q12I22_SHEDO|nr:hypothetical protein [Shewanella denitrificans]ABE56904.1 conserved hypothetical protein [Shewanella denitrificans OS217]